MNTLTMGGRHHAWRRLAVRRARPAGGRALNVCCGAGDFALEVARQGASTVVAVDFSPEMLGKERAAANPRKILGRTLSDAPMYKG